MKKFAFLVLVSIFFLGTAGTGSASDARTWNLRFTGTDNETHPSVANGLIPWTREVERVTNGRVRIRYFNPNTIAPATEIPTSIESGAIDMGVVDHGRTAGLFPLHDVFVLPLLSNSSTAHGLAAWRVYQQTPALQNEMRKYKILGYWGGGGLHILTLNRPVRSLEDLKGMRITAMHRAAGDTVAALGANPVVMPVPDYYMALSRKTADGALFSMLAAPSIKLDELVKHATVVNILRDLRFVGMNWDVWNSFPPEIQKAIESISGDEAFARRISEAMDSADIVGRKVLEGAGCSFYTLSPEEFARWVDACKDLDQVWLDRVVKAGAATREEAEALLKTVREAGVAASAEIAK